MDGFALMLMEETQYPQSAVKPRAVEQDTRVQLHNRLCDWTRCDCHTNNAEFHRLSEALGSSSLFPLFTSEERTQGFFNECLHACPPEWLQSSIFSGGLQTSQIHYSYNEEKDEDHCSSPGGTPASKSRLCTHKRALGDHSQAFLQALADNNIQDHTVKVCEACPPSPSPFPLGL